jgi:hypothetical protein
VLRSQSALVRRAFRAVARELSNGDLALAALVGHSLGSMTNRFLMWSGDIVRD